MSNMSNFFSSLILFLVAIFTSCTADTKSDLMGLNVNGSVNKFVENTYYTKKESGQWVKGGLKYRGHQKVFFDKNGNYEWIHNLNIKNDIKSKIHFKRKEDQIIEFSNYDNNDDLITNSKLTYSSKDSVEFIMYDEQGELFCTVNLLLNTGKVIKETFKYSSHKDHEFTTLREYDNSKKLLGEQIFENGEVVGSIKYEYLEFDENDNWIKRLSYDSRENEPSIVVREYHYY